MLNAIKRYFDLQSNRRSATSTDESVDQRESFSESPTKPAPVLPQYLTVSTGVIVEPLLSQYVQSGAWQVEWGALAGRAVFGLIVGIILLPAVYKSAFDPQKPIFVQLAALFPMGIGWQSLFTSATKIVAG